ncbi:MAG: signal peptidase I [Ktedonobacteraceae bacterium]
MNPEFNFEKRYRLVREIIETIVLTLLMFFVIRFAIQNFNVDGTSMEPNLHNTELIIVDKWTYLFHPPVRGDVIVFAAPPHPDMDYVKRVIGLPGDVITIRGTTVIVDGVTLSESYVDPQNQGNPFASKNITNLVIPAGDYFVLGDNREVSSDSRDWGYVPVKNIVGRAAIVYWPLGQDNNGFLKNYTSVFANVHQSTSTALSHPGNSPGGLGLDADGFVLILLPGLSLAFWRKREALVLP